MARYGFGGGIADWSFTAVDAVDGNDDIAQLTGGVVIEFYNSETGGTQYTDLLDESGNPVTSVTSADGTGSRSIGQIPPFSGPDGVTTMWASAGGGPRALMVTTDAADAVNEPGTILPPLSVSGAVSVGTGRHRLYNDTTSALTIAGVRASVGTAPTGSALTVDVNRNGTTIFSTQANRPSIAAGSNTSGKVTAMDVTDFAIGDYLTVDVDAAGTGAQDLVVQILVTRA